MKILKQEYSGSGTHTPINNIQEYSEDQLSRGIDTAPTDSKSMTNTTEKKIYNNGSIRRKRNINIRKINKKSGKGKKSAKSMGRSGPGEWIHEKVEEEDEVELKSNNNKDLDDIEVDLIAARPK